MTAGSLAACAGVTFPAVTNLPFSGTVNAETAGLDAAFMAFLTR